MSAVIEDSGEGIRRMSEHDLDEIMDIETATYDYPWTRGIFQDCLRVGYDGWVIQFDGEIKAYGVLSKGGGEAHVLSLVVAPAMRRQGLGRILLEHMISHCRARKISDLFLEVRPSNPAAIKLYQSMGFNEVGLRADYYPAANGREDALVMTLTLLDAADTE